MNARNATAIALHEIRWFHCPFCNAMFEGISINVGRKQLKLHLKKEHSNDEAEKRLR